MSLQFPLFYKPVKVIKGRIGYQGTFSLLLWLNSCWTRLLFKQGLSVYQSDKASQFFGAIKLPGTKISSKKTLLEIGRDGRVMAPFQKYIARLLPQLRQNWSDIWYIKKEGGLFFYTVFLRAVLCHHVLFPGFHSTKCAAATWVALESVKQNWMSFKSENLQIMTKEAEVTDA